MADEKEEATLKMGQCVVAVGEDYIKLNGPGGAKIIIDGSGITIDNGKGALVKLTGATTDVNTGALTVT